jgi:anion-transporting  ArsA/GET3 family ATPase
MKEISAVESAQNKINGIQQAIVDGNTKLTAADLSSARAELEFAELQQQAAEIVKQTTIEADRKAHLLELQKRLKVISDSRKTVDTKFADFEKSLANYLTSATTYQNNLNNLRGALRGADLYPESDVIIAGVTPGKVAYGIQIQDRMRTLSIGEISATNLTPNDAIKPLIESALGEYSRNF